MAYSSFLTISMDRIRLIRSRALIEKLACLVKYSSQDVCYRTLLTNLLGTGIMIVHLDPKYRHNCLLIIISHTYTPIALHTRTATVYRSVPSLGKSNQGTSTQHSWSLYWKASMSNLNCPSSPYPKHRGYVRMTRKEFGDSCSCILFMGLSG